MGAKPAEGHSKGGSPKERGLASRFLTAAGLVLLVFLVFAPLQSLGHELLVLQQGASHHSLGGHLEGWEDPTGAQTFEQALEQDQQGHFQELGTRQAFGLTRSTWWLRFRLENRAETDQWILLADFPTLDRIDLYSPDGKGGYTLAKSGDMVAYGQRSSADRNIIFPLRPPPGQATTYYLRVETSSAMVVPLELFEKAAYHAHDDQLTLFYGIYYGAILVMVFYNLFLFSSLKDPQYLLYVLYIFTFGLYQVATNGVAYSLLWPNWPWFNSAAVLFFMFTAMSFGLWFSRSFLELPTRQPRLDKLALALIVLGFILAFSPAYTGIYAADHLAYLVAPLAMATIFLTGLRGYLKGFQPARYFVIAVFLFMVGSVSFALLGRGLLGVNWFTLHGMQLGHGLEAALFSLALGDRYNLMRSQKERAEVTNALTQEENLALKLEINQRLAAEAQLKEAHQAAEEARERAEAATRIKDKFVALVAHDIRSPFSSILGLVDLLDRDASNPLNGDQREIVALIQNRGRDFMRMTDELLNLNRLQTGAITPEKTLFHGRALVEEIFLLRHLATKKGVDLINNIPEKEEFYADRRLFFEVILNLVSNAIKFTSKGDTVTLYSPKPNTISVQDTGAGIPEVLIPRLFSHLEKTSTLGTDGEKGSGLGLPICYEIIKAHQGEITVNSKKGEGATFTVRLPPPPKKKGKK